MIGGPGMLQYDSPTKNHPRLPSPHRHKNSIAAQNCLDEGATTRPEPPQIQKDSSNELKNTLTDCEQVSNAMLELAMLELVMT